ncbi:MAG: DNA-formamidopyrimidine glycosylase family protein [Anaerolineaceae bacterium]
MFEIPEIVNFARQMNGLFIGKTIKTGHLGNSPHKFVWYNRTPQEFEQITRNKKVGETRTMGRWLLTNVEPGYVLVIGEWGGHILFHQPESMLPTKYHLHLQFDDNSFLTATTQMWGAVELYEQGRELERQYIKDMKLTPMDEGFTLSYFTDLIETITKDKKQSVKGLLTQDQTIPGLGNSIAQDIMYLARLHPKHDLQTLTEAEIQALFQSILETVKTCIQKGGRNDEFDLFNQLGGYVRLMDKNSVGKPCLQCGSQIEKAQYLGGAIYFCPTCQK